MISKHLHPLYIAEILSNHSDQDHILTQPEILNLLETEYGITITRQTFYNAINLLQLQGVDIETYSENRKGYFLKKRPFSKEQILLLCHLTDASMELPEGVKKATKDLLLKFLSKPMSHEVLGALNDIPPSKTYIETLKNLELLSKAISQQQKISFDYSHFNEKKVRTLDQNTFDNMEPRFVTRKEDHFYLITSGGPRNRNEHYRVDRMRNIMIKNESVASNFSHQDVFSYAYHRMNMFSSTPVPVRVRVNNGVRNIFDKIVDEFGEDAYFEPYDEKWTDVVTRASPDGLLILAQKYIDAFYVVKPVEVRQAMIRRLKKSLSWYLMNEEG